MSQQPKCPGCGSTKHVTRRADGDCWCGRCKVMFDGDDPDEGGDYSDFNPAARLEREERRKARR